MFLSLRASVRLPAARVVGAAGLRGLCSLCVEGVAGLRNAGADCRFVVRGEPALTFLLGRSTFALSCPITRAAASASTKACTSHGPLSSLLVSFGEVVPLSLHTVFGRDSITSHISPPRCILEYR